MRITEHPIQHRMAIFFYVAFSAIYLLLLTRGLIAINEGPDNLIALRHHSIIVVSIKRACGILIEPFYAVVIPPSPESNAYFLETIVFALLCYLFFHYGMFASLPIAESKSMITKILSTCRMVFFVSGSLLILLVVLRMGVELYYDLTEHGSRGHFIIADPATK